MTWLDWNTCGWIALAIIFAAIVVGTINDRMSELGRERDEWE